MKQTKIKVEVTRSKNYQSIKLETTITLEEGEDPAKLRDAATTILNNEALATLKKWSVEDIEVELI